MRDEQTVLYSVDAGVATITLNRPERRNAVTPEMLQVLRTRFEAAGEDERVRAVLVTGAGKGFCAGQDLSIFGGIPEPEAVRDVVLNYYRPLIESICRLEKPVVAAINGVAAGAAAHEQHDWGDWISGRQPSRPPRGGRWSSGPRRE